MANKLLNIFRKEKVDKSINGIYQLTQILFSYNSNHIEGSMITKDETYYLYTTNSIFSNGSKSINADDVLDTKNHFRAFDYILDYEGELSHEFIKKLHSIIKAGRDFSTSRGDPVGNYKKYPNFIGDKRTISPSKVFKEMDKLIKDYNKLKTKTIEDIIDFHYRFENIHPFGDGNGRVGRLIMFRECLSNDITPFIIDNERKNFYYRGLKEYEKTKGYLIDTCLFCQDIYVEHLNYYGLSFEEKVDNLSKIFKENIKEQDNSINLV